MKRVFPLFALILGLALRIGACTAVPASPPAGEASTNAPAVATIATTAALSGTVRDENGPVAGAIVRVQTTDHVAHTDSAGRFTLTGLTPGEAVSVSAWAPGYYIGGGEEARPGDEITIMLEPLPAADNADYAWVSAFAEAGAEGNCQNCHAATQEQEGSLPFDEWQHDPHSRAAQNPRFLSMYAGTDLQGHRSPLTRYADNPDYGRFPLPPDFSQPYYGPGYKLDFPASAGNCAACHTPAAAVVAPYGTDPRAVAGVGAEGITCDFCHKIWDVRLNPDTGLPYPNMPGVLSLAFRRPPEGHQFFAGPFDDVAPGEDTFVPLYTQSRYCAACHFGDFWNVRIYNAFGEWLASPYSDPQQATEAGLSGAQTCQDCHMPPGKNDHFVRFAKHGRRRAPETIFSHDMTVTPDLLRRALTLQVQAERTGEGIRVTVTVTNTGAGHHVPTDSPLRQVILLVQATDAEGHSLPLVKGPVLPAWAGTHSTETPAASLDAENYAGLPGRLYAKTLQEIWTEVVPSGAYWNPTRVVEDTRLPALGHDTSTYLFATTSGHGPYTLTVTLRYRRAFLDLMRQKGWNVPDIILAERTWQVTEP